MTGNMMNEQKMHTLIQARLRQGWAQADLAEKMGVATKTVARWEAGSTIPQPVYRAKLGALLHIDPEELWPLNASPSVLSGSTDQISAPPSQKTEQPLALPTIWNVPFARNPFFTGREDLLTHLHARFQASQALALSQSQAISGLGGIGKTQLALEYAYRYHHDYQAVLWARAESTEALLSSYVAIAMLLRLPESEAKVQEIIIQAVKTWLQSHRGWLLILDNADELALLPDFLPSTLGGHLLLTTRAAAIGRLAHRLEIDTLEPAQGALFLLRRAALIAPDETLEQASQEEQELAVQISQELGGLPLALDQAGAYLEETGTDLTGYWLIYQQHRADLLQKRGGLVADHPAPVATTWSLSFQQVEEKNPTAADLLRVCALLSPDTIPEELLTAGASLLGPRLASVAGDAFLLNQAIEALRAYSLIQRDPKGKTLSIHRLVQAVLQNRLSEMERRTWSERVMFAVNAAFPQVEHSTWPQCERLLPQALTAARIIEQDQLIGEEAGRLLHETADYLHERARYAEAEPLYQRALRIREQQLGSQHPEVASSLNNLANLYLEQGKYAEAEPLYQRALRIREQQLGPQHPEVASSLFHLARLYRRQGKYAEAEPLFQRALHIREQWFGPQHPEVGASLDGLANLLREQGKYAEAEPLYQRALRIREQQLGSQHPEVASSLNNLARLYLEQGKYAEAELLYQRALRIREQQLGPQHPWVAYSLDGLANLLREQGKYAEAEPLFQRALHIREQQLGPQHPEVTHPLNNLARLYLEQGKYAEAEPLFQRALRIREQQLGPQHPWVAYSLTGLADLFLEQGKYAEAEPLFQRALRIHEQQLGPQHPQMTHPLNNLARLYLEQGKRAEAELLFQRALRIHEQQLGPQHPWVAYPLTGLANLSLQQGKYAEAESLYQRALRIRERTRGSHHLETAETMHDLAQFREVQGNCEEAKTWYARALEVREQVLGAHHPKTVQTRNRFFVLLHAMGQRDEGDQIGTVQAEPPATENSPKKEEQA